MNELHYLRLQRDTSSCHCLRPTDTTFVWPKIVNVQDWTVPVVCTRYFHSDRREEYKKIKRVNHEKRRRQLSGANLKAQLAPLHEQVDSNCNRYTPGIITQMGNSHSELSRPLTCCSGSTIRMERFIVASIENLCCNTGFTLSFAMVTIEFCFLWIKLPMEIV